MYFTTDDLVKGFDESKTIKVLDGGANVAYCVFYAEFIDRIVQLIGELRTVYFFKNVDTVTFSDDSRGKCIRYFFDNGTKMTVSVSVVDFFEYKAEINFESNKKKMLDFINR